ncbi:ribosome assembly protein METTL17, mitochondrial [Euwallacea similis]|uniref:ribosome assembly protein METTL17, mitochondrial n=1 Tax=Euwallacea similis TaxID=1736056 RepID=UPI00344B355C
MLAVSKDLCLQCLKNNFMFCTLRNISIVPDANFIKDVSLDSYKPKHHPGRMDNKILTLPDTFLKAVLKAVEDYPIKAVVESGSKLTRHLKGRVPLMEKDIFQSTVNKIKNNLEQRHQNMILKDEEDEQKFEKMINDKLYNILKRKVYNWKPIKYDVYTSLAYLLGRAPAEYAVLTKIFSEIVNRDKEFTPKSLFDFGSGVGTVTWAANAFWKKHIFEYFNVDPSADMNDLAQILLQGGKGTGNVVKGTFYRQFLPATNVKYDLVASSYSLLELPSAESRLETVLNLWNKTHQYLIIVEQGTNAGFKVVNEVRDFILGIDKESNKSHVFSPCPHDSMCPRFLANDGTPCNFSVRYWTMPIGSNPQLLTETYSYVVLKKGHRENNVKWPRIVRAPLVRPRHTICRMCTANGKLREATLTLKKHGKTTYHCARSSKWGDLLPVTFEDENSDAVPENNHTKSDNDIDNKKN